MLTLGPYPVVAATQDVNVLPFVSAISAAGANGVSLSLKCPRCAPLARAVNPIAQPSRESPETCCGHFWCGLKADAGGRIGALPLTTQCRHRPSTRVGPLLLRNGQHGHHGQRRRRSAHPDSGHEPTKIDLHPIAVFGRTLRSDSCVPIGLDFRSLSHIPFTSRPIPFATRDGKNR